MTPEIKAAIEKEAEKYQDKHWDFEPCEGWTGLVDKIDFEHLEPKDSFKFGAEFGYKLAKEKLDIAITALKKIAVFTENKEEVDSTFDEPWSARYARKALKDLGE